MTNQFSSAWAAAVMFAGLTVTPALAQVPGGSYLESCGNVHGQGDRLIADCRREDGSWRRTVLRDVDSCRGDISNQNGRLACNRGGPPYGAYGYQPYAQPQPPYGAYGYQPYAQPQPPGQGYGYGYPYGYGR